MSPEPSIATAATAPLATRLKNPAELPAVVGPKAIVTLKVPWGWTTAPATGTPVAENGATGSMTPEITTGVALTEIYDTDSGVGARLINVSARMNVTGGEGTLIAGFVIGGTLPKTVLIRGVGPTLSTLGAVGVLAHPQITLFSGSTQIATNSNWAVGNNVTQLTYTVAQVGAFSLTTGSLDAAMISVLQPGSYSVQITGVGNTSGVALLEVYDVQ